MIAVPLFTLGGKFLCLQKWAGIFPSEKQGGKFLCLQKRADIFPSEKQGGIDDGFWKDYED